MICPVHAARSHIVDFEHGVLPVKFKEGALGLALDTAEDGRKHAWRLRCAFA